MDSTGSTSTLVQRCMPCLAIFRHDLRALRSSWLVRLWLAATVLLTLGIIAVGWKDLPSAHLIAAILVPYLVFPWFLVVMVLGVTPLSGTQADALADSFLSRPITRQEYLLGVWASRVAVTVGVYLLVIVPAVALVAFANRTAPADHVTLWGIAASLTVVGLVLALQVSLGFLFGTLLRKPLLAIVMLLFLWYPVNVVLHSFKLESFSPISLSQAIPNLLRQSWSHDAPASEKDAQKLAAGLAAMDWTSLVPGGAPARNERGAYFSHVDDYKDFSLLRVLLGYGVPTVLSAALAAWVFASRDL